MSLQNGSSLLADTENLGNAGNIFIDASSIVISGVGENTFSSQITSTVDGGGDPTVVGNAGNIEINTGSLSITDGGFISTSTFGEGNGGSIEINASGLISLENSSISSNIGNSGVGDGGSINITTNDLSLTNGASVEARVFGEGDTGAINISASNQVFIANSEESPFISIRNNIESDGIGNSAGITIDANSLSVNDGAQIQSLVRGIGNSGKIAINADLVEFSGRDVMGDFPSGAFSSVEFGGQGNAGGIDITANRLLVSDRAQLSSSTQGVGDAGDIDLQIATETTLLSSSIISEVSEATQMSAGGFGEGGEINITTDSLLLQNGSSLLADTENQGNAGNISINAKEQLVLEGEGQSAMANSTNIFPSQISTTVQSQAIGDAGNISISTASLQIRNDGFINATTQGQGRGGIIDVVSNEIQLDDGGKILAETASGEGGNIFLDVSDNLTLRSNSLISASAFNDANGGNLTIDANFIIAFPDGNNDITASAQQGEGGVININAESILGIEERPLNDLTNDINASSEDSDLDGDVTIDTSDINFTQRPTELPTNIIEVDRSVARVCNDRNTGTANNFVIKGKGGVPPVPTAPLSLETTIVSEESAASIESYGIATARGMIIPARGVTKTKDGRIILTAVPSGDASRLPDDSLNCRR